ncbi:MAG: hypothetical protein U0168_00070 [Nannocystaceae bacterium]
MLVHATREQSDAVEPVLGHVQLAQGRAHRREQRRGLEPAEHRGPMHAVHRREPLARQLCEVALAQQVALPRREAREPVAHGLGQRRAVGLPHVVELGIGAVGDAIEQRRVAAGRVDGPGLAHQIDHHPRGRDADPAAQGPATTVGADPRGAVGRRDQQSLAHALAEVLPGAGLTTAHPRVIDVAQERGVEGRERPAITGRARAREPEILGVHVGQRIGGLAVVVDGGGQREQEPRLQRLGHACALPQRRQGRGQLGLQPRPRLEALPRGGREPVEEPLHQRVGHCGRDRIPPGREKTRPAVRRSWPTPVLSSPNPPKGR